MMTSVVVTSFVVVLHVVVSVTGGVKVWWCQCLAVSVSGRVSVWWCQCLVVSVSGSVSVAISLSDITVFHYIMKCQCASHLITRVSCNQQITF